MIAAQVARHGGLAQQAVHIHRIVDAGIRLESVREVFSYLREHVGSDIASAHIVISGANVVLCDGDELIDILKKGQGVLNILPLAGVKNEVDTSLVNIVGAHALPPAHLAI